jgi:mono/diheme cytochrome c family protein
MRYLNPKTKIVMPLILALLFLQSTTLVEKWKAPASADNFKNPYKNSIEASKAGKQLYKTYCAICHGDKGKGDGMAAAALTPRPANFTSSSLQVQTDGAIYWKLTNGKAPMASYKTILSDKQRWQLVNYIRELGKK